MHFCQANRKSFWQECVGADLSSSLRLKVLTRKRARAHKHTDGGEGGRERRVTQSAPWNSVENQLNNIFGFALQTVRPWQPVKTAWQLLSTNYLCWEKASLLLSAGVSCTGCQCPAPSRLVRNFRLRFCFAFIVKTVRYVKSEGKTNIVFSADEYQSCVPVQVNCSHSAVMYHWCGSMARGSIAGFPTPPSLTSGCCGDSQRPTDTQKHSRHAEGNHQSLRAHAFKRAECA